MTPRPRALAALAAALALVAPASRIVAQDPYVSPGQARLKADVYYLADDAREGRGVGTKGLDAAADHIATAFKEAGLKPAPGADGYFQYFDLPGQRQVTDDTTLSIAAKKDGDQALKAEFKKEFTPLALGGPGEFKGLPIVFAGYGITAKDEDAKLDYDDYGDLDVKDKAILIIRRKPQQTKEDGPFGNKENTTYSAFNHKVANAAKRGVRAILLVNDGETAKEKDELLDYASVGGGGNASFGFFQVTREFADKVLKAGGAGTVAELEKAIDGDLKPRSKALEGVTLDSVVKIETRPIKVKNVIGVLEGAGPKAEETLVIGAHYDHVGMGGNMMSLAPGVRAVHNGADDNASGTATVMELARRLGKRTDPLPRRIVFMAFSAEEMGLIGSRYYVNNPLIPLDKTVTMINFDMVGRLNKDKEVTVFGAGSSPGFESLVNSLITDQGMKTNNIGGTQGEFNQSDHASFYYKNMPILFFFTGTHPDYHRPADDSDKINYEGMARIADVGELLALDIARRPDRPEFVKLGRTAPAAVAVKPDAPKADAHAAAPSNSTSASSRSLGSAYFGSRPSYGDTGGKGVKLDGVSEGGPAEKAGLKEGDVIIKFAGKDVKDLDTYMAALSEKKPGDTVEVVVKRDGEDKTFQVKLGTRPNSVPKN